MVRIALISCVSKKLDHKAMAKDLYNSPLFKYSYRFAKTFHPDKLFILSAKYCLVSTEDMIEPYNLTLRNFKDKELREWSERVLEKLRRSTDVDNDEFIILAGEKYRKHLLPYIKKYSIPLKGLGIGKQLGFMKNALRKTA